MNIISALFSNSGGIHPDDAKKTTAALPSVVAPIPPLLAVSLAQHLGAPSKTLVKKGDTVLRGQPIADSAGFVSARVHAPTSGKIVSVGLRMTASGRTAPVIEIESDGQDQPFTTEPPAGDWTTLPPRELIERIHQAGIIGMGGAGFPTQVKLSPPPGKTIQTLILNGAECEPFLTADHRLMVEQAEAIIAGIRVLQHIFKDARVRIAVEDNKPDALAALAQAADILTGDVQMVRLRTAYPQGAEKQLIYSITGREVPSGGLPMDVQTLVENVATVQAIGDAVIRGFPLIERVLTVTGPAITQPRNIRARIGTPFSDLIAFCGGPRGPIGRLICGGPLMGIAQSGLAGAVTKTTSGLLVLPPEREAPFSSMPCISCGRCVDACPIRLLPCTLSETSEAEQDTAAEDLKVMDCIECGCCAYVCPARRPLVQHMRRAKARVQILRKQREAQKKKQPV
jgi:electron transport complex protein RnfC